MILSIIFTNVILQYLHSNSPINSIIINLQILNTKKNESHIH